MGGEEDEWVLEGVDERQVNDEYKTWKKSTPMLYDLVITHALEWPSLTVQWVPVYESNADLHAKYLRQKLILGTHTSENEQNYLMLAEVLLPTENLSLDDLDPCAEGFGGAQQRNVRIVQQINHDGEVNRARHMPQDSSFIATKTVSAEVYVFDTSKHPSKPPPDGVCNPDLRLIGHKTEGYGLAWHQFHTGHLLSGSDDAQICLWDIQGTSRENKMLDAKTTYHEHSGVVEDVAWHGHHTDIFGSVGDDRQLILWDTRKPPNQGVMVAAEAHTAEVNCIAFNPYNPHVLATGSADKTVALHDWRNLSQRLHVLRAHQEEVFQIGWSPKYETILCSCGADRRVMVWDLSRIGEEQRGDDAAQGPPELLFIHGGHTAKVSDLALNPSYDWVMASVAEDNILQVWQMAEHVYKCDDEADGPHAGDEDGEMMAEEDE